MVDEYHGMFLLGRVGCGLYWIFTMDSPEYEAKNIDLKDIGHNHLTKNVDWFI